MWRWVVAAMDGNPVGLRCGHVTGEIDHDTGDQVLCHAIAGGQPVDPRNEVVERAGLGPVAIGGVRVKARPHDVEITSINPPAVPVDDIGDLGSVNRGSEARIHSEDRSRRRKSEPARLVLIGCHLMASEEP